MITIKLPLDSKSIRDGKAMEKKMRSMGIRFDFKKEVLDHFESEIKKAMRGFKNPATRKPVSFNLRRTASGLVLSVNLEEEHKEELLRNLGI